MRKLGKILSFTVASCAMVAFAMPAAAKDKAPTPRQLVKQYCRVCHGPNSPNGEYTPMTFIQDQWTDFFANTYKDAHKGVVDPHHNNKKVLEEITPDMLKKIEKYMVDHAADSEHPMTCG